MYLCQWKRYRVISGHHSTSKSDWQLHVNLRRQYHCMWIRILDITNDRNDNTKLSEQHCRITVKGNHKEKLHEWDREEYLTIKSLNCAILIEYTICKVENVKINICNMEMF